MDTVRNTITSFSGNRGRSSRGGGGSGLASQASGFLGGLLSGGGTGGRSGNRSRARRR